MSTPKCFKRGLSHLVVCDFKLFTTTCSIINRLAITVSEPTLVFRMLLSKLKPYSTDI